MCVCVCVCVCVTFLVHLSISEHVGCFHILAIITNATIIIECTYVFKLVFLFSLEKYPDTQFSSVKLLSHVQLFVTPWIAAH